MKKPTLKEIEKRLDTLVQTVQRCESFKMKAGVPYSKCVTCGKIVNCFGKNCMQGGHFIPRGCRITRWEADNVHPQCTRCNGFMGGAYIEYGNYMINRYGKEKYDSIIALYNLHKNGRAHRLTPIEKYSLYNSWLHKGRVLEEKTGMKIFPKSWIDVTI